MKSKLAGIAFTATAVAITALAGLSAPAAWAQVSVAISIAPPPLPIYDQPPVPGDGFIWTPGYWAWSPREGAYFWVPGTWVEAPGPDELWTPGYWAYEGSGYFWHAGYWGRQVGFYGGLNYGFGYFGSGYQGGRWDGGVFRYNRAVSNVNTRVVHGVYNSAASNPRRNDHVSFNGGHGGTTARPTSTQRRFQAADHPGPNAAQMEHEHAAMTAPTQRATGPHGMPQVAATPKPSGFADKGSEHMRREPAPAPAPTPAAHPTRPPQAHHVAQPAHMDPSRQQPAARPGPPPRPAPAPAPAPRAEPPHQQPAARPAPPPRQEAQHPPEPRHEERRKEPPQRSKEDPRKEH